MICQNHFAQPCGHFELRSPTERNFVDVQCPTSKGTTFIVNQGFRYELWAEDALIKFIERDFSISVSCASTALERFNEAFIKFCLFEIGLEKDDIETAWKELSALSERQLGALSLAQSVFAKKKRIELPKPPRKVAELRNKVVHGGYFPTDAEARSHAESIFSFIATSIDAMKKFPESLQKLALLEISKGYAFANQEIQSRGLDKDNCAIATLAFPYRLSINHISKNFVFEELIADCKSVHKLG